VAERTGYVFRRSGVTAEELRALLGAVERGWAWTPADMYDAGRQDDLLRGNEGRACRDNLEVRWHCGDSGYDLLVLALEELALAGFAPLLADGYAWRTAQTTLRLQRPAAVAGESDEELPATSFIAPDGAVQFVALIDSAERSAP
jgi:hypothetical protein